MWQGPGGGASTPRIREAVPRRARIQGSHTFASLNSRLESIIKRRRRRLAHAHSKRSNNPHGKTKPSIFRSQIHLARDSNSNLPDEKWMRRRNLLEGRADVDGAVDVRGQLRRHSKSFVSLNSRLESNEEEKQARETPWRQATALRHPSASLYKSTKNPSSKEEEKRPPRRSRQR